jgi:hypothetical protein
VGSRSLEAGGDKPHNHGLSEFKPLSTDRGVGWGVKKPEEPKQQPSDPYHELYEHYRQEQERHSGVLENPIRVPRPNWPKKPKRGR